MESNDIKQELGAVVKQEVVEQGEAISQPSQAHDTEDAQLSPPAQDDSSSESEESDSDSEETPSDDPITFPHLEAALQKTSVAQLDRDVRSGLEVLDKILDCLKRGRSKQVTQWESDVTQTHEQYSETPYVVAVVGATGHGKSSLINALLGEVNLVPTSGKGAACTAVVTEVSHNASTDDDCVYKSEADFLTVKEWDEEFQNMCKDVTLEDGQLSPEIRERESGAATSWSKLKVLFPGIKRQLWPYYDKEALRKDPAILKMVGKNHSESHRNVKDLMKHAKSYSSGGLTKVTWQQNSDIVHAHGNNIVQAMSSAQGGNAAARPVEEAQEDAELFMDDDGDQVEPAEDVQSHANANDAVVDKNSILSQQSQQYHKSVTEKGFRKFRMWPLIKKVRIRTREKLLSNGLSVADVPGTQDSNAARGAMANRYIETCNETWVVADSTRAINDRAAQELLGKSFRRQLHLDGSLDSLTFICTKADIQRLDEAVHEFGLGHEYEKVKEQETAIKEFKKDAEARAKRIQHDRETLSLVQKEIESRLGQLREALLICKAEGSVSTIPSTQKRKRKNTGGGGSSKKRARREKESQEPSEVELTLQKMDEKAPCQLNGGPYDEAQIQDTVRYYEDEKSELEDKEEALEEALEQDKSKRGKLRHDHKVSLMNLRHEYIQKRQRYMGAGVRGQFAEMLRDLEQVNSNSDDPGDGNTAAEYVDDNSFTKRAQALPVFCVSSQAYQAFQGLCDGDTSTHGFPDIESTDMPRLIRFAKEASEAHRIRGHKHFLNSLLGTVLAMALWSRQHNLDAKAEAKRLKQPKDNVKRETDVLETKLRRAVSSLMEDIKIRTLDILLGQLHKAVSKAEEEAGDIAQQWPKGPNNPGGFPFATYKAACRRKGCYESRFGEIDFNADLANPLIQDLVKPWRDAFESIKAAIKGAMVEMERTIEEFVQQTQVHIKNFLSVSVLNSIKKQLCSFTATVDRIYKKVEDIMEQHRKASSRLIVPEVQDFMNQIYERCAEEKGKGSFIRMQEIMQNFIETKKFSIFRSIPKVVKEDLDQMCDEMGASLQEWVGGTLRKVDTAFGNVLPDGNDDHDAAETNLSRKEIWDILSQTDELFMVEPEEADEHSTDEPEKADEHSTDESEEESELSMSESEQDED